MLKERENNYNRCLLVLFVILFLSIIIALSVGRYPLTNKDILSFLHNDTSSIGYKILLQIRLPRIILAILLGASLSVAGVLFQAIFQNPLASPGILGVSAAGGFGASLAILIGLNSYFLIQLSAWICGLFSIILVLTIAKLGRRARPFLMILLAGIIISSFFRASTSIIKYLAEPDKQLATIVFWLLGSFSKVTWQETYLSLPFLLPSLLIALAMRYRLDLLTLTEEEAISLGLNIKVYRRLFIGLGTLLVATSVAACGPIAWIGLVIPHWCRILIGPKHNYLVPISMLAGAIFLLLCDTLARSLISSEIPIGIITSILGTPLFTYLLIRKGTSGWG